MKRKPLLVLLGVGALAYLLTHRKQTGTAPVPASPMTTFDAGLTFAGSGNPLTGVSQW